jgi:hypothetical protein
LQGLTRPTTRVWCRMSTCTGCHGHHVLEIHVRVWASSAAWCGAGEESARCVVEGSVGGSTGWREWEGGQHRIRYKTLPRPCIVFQKEKDNMGTVATVATLCGRPSIEREDWRGQGSVLVVLVDKIREGWRDRAYKCMCMVWPAPHFAKHKRARKSASIHAFDQDMICCPK